jgi:hypothetical protein
MKATDRQRKRERRLRRRQIRRSMVEIRARIKGSGGDQKRVGEAS